MPVDARPGKADNVTRGVDVRDCGAVVFVNFEIAALSGLEAGRAKIQGSGVTSPSRCNKDCFGSHDAPRLQG